MSANYRFVDFRCEGRIAVITLNRPEVLNAWNAVMRREVGDALRAVDADGEVRAAVITGAGTRAFCAGQDLTEAKAFDADRAAAWIEEWGKLYGAFRDLTKPLVAALNGLAAGSGFQAALLTDIRVGHPGVRLGQPEINAGIPSTTGPWIMREMLGLSRTIELTLTGRMMEGEECRACGLISHLVDEESVLDKALEIATLLASKPPLAMRLNKRHFRELTQPGLDAALAAGLVLQREAYGSGEPQEMMRRFLAKRARRKDA